MSNRVLSDNMLSDFFDNKHGLIQGEVLSPILFSLYMNDFENWFIEDNIVPCEFRDLALFLLMYADDMVLFAETAEGLQEMLDSLSRYSHNYGLTVNTDKTKVLVFRNAGIVKNKWTYNGKEVELVDCFNYLGLLLNYNGKFNGAQTKLAEQGRKALFSLQQKTKTLYLNVQSMLSLFDTYVASVMFYGCEIWGNSKALSIEKLHTDFCKRLLGVKSTTVNAAVYHELGRYPLQVYRKVRIFKYWLKLLYSSNCILQESYNFLLDLCNTKPSFKHNWLLCVKQELFNLGMCDMWFSPYKFDSSYTLTLLKQRLIDQCKQDILCKIQSTSKCYVYQYITDHHCLQFYLFKGIPTSLKNYIAKIRLSSHNLAVEVGRYRKVDKHNRFCFYCKDCIEDEYHFILQCPLYKLIRVKYIKPYYWQKPSMFKLIQELCNFGMFLRKSFSLRSNQQS